MKRFMNRRSLGILAAIAASQLLSACVILPWPYYGHHREMQGDYRRGYDAPPPRDYRDHGDRRDWDGRR